MMTPAQKALHLHLIRLLKGCLSAWEHYVKVYADESPQTLPRDVPPGNGTRVDASQRNGTP
jgi:hypothetical protein